MKKYLAFLAAAIMLIALVGCSGTPSSSDPGTTPTTTANAVAPTQPEATQGDATQGDATQGDATQGDATQGDATQAPTEAGKTEAGKTEAPKTEAPKTEANKTDAPVETTTQAEVIKTQATPAPSRTAAATIAAQYVLDAKGSPYATGIKLPKLDNPNVVYMTNTTWEFIQDESSEKAPTAIYHAMLIWKAVYNVDVTISLVDWDSFSSFLTTAVVSGEAPDVMRYTAHPNWIVNNLVAPLNGLFNLDDPDYDKEAAARYAYKGNTYVGFSKGTPVLNNVIVYNKSKFEMAGEKTPLELWEEGKWNWDAFVKAAKALTDPENDQYGFNGWGLYPTSFPMITMNDDGTLKLWTEDPKFVEFMTKVYDLYHVEKAARNTEDLANYKNTFPTGTDAMVLVTSSDYPIFLEYAKRNGNNDEFGIAPAPTYDFIGETGPRGDKSLGTMGWSMSAAPMNQTAALEFIRLVLKVGTNITKTAGKYGILTEYLTDDEKAMMDKVQPFKTGYGSDITYGVGNCELIKNEQCITHMYMGGQAVKTLSEILNALTPFLQEDITAWELQNGLA